MSRRQRGGTLLGVLIGLVLGFAIAAAAGLYFTGGWKAYQQQVAGHGDAKDAARDSTKVAKAEPDKPRFDFYKILPGGEDAKNAPARHGVPDRPLVDKSTSTPPGSDIAALDRGKGSESSEAAKPPDRFWLQAGSFGSESDAENLRARLALSGWEAQMQQGTMPDKAIRYRVRLGPYDNVAELNRIKGELARRGFDVAVIRY